MKAKTLLQKADEIMPTIANYTAEDAAVTLSMARSRASESARATALVFLNAQKERDLECLIDYCRANLDANAWLPKAWQLRLFNALIETRATLVEERAAHLKAREELCEDVIRVRREYARLRAQACYLANRVHVLTARIPAAGKPNKKRPLPSGLRLARRRTR